MKAPNVVSLFGNPVPDGKAEPACVKMLQELLERAQSGEIKGVAIAAQRDNGHASWFLAGNLESDPIVARLSKMIYIIHRSEDDE